MRRNLQLRPLNARIVALTAGAALVAALAPACGGGDGSAASAPASTSTASAATVPDLSPAELSARGVDEGGLVPVLMYHEVAASVAADDAYSTTPESLRADLARLYAAGYRPVSLSDLVDGRIAIPLGTTPVVLTFDDGTPGQFRLTPDGATDPDSAVGILDAFADAHPAWPRRAVFYVNDVPFGDAATAGRKLRMLVDRGYEVGNHTVHHADLSKADASTVRAELGGMSARLARLLPGVTIRHMALPFGTMPSPPTLARTGSGGGGTYRHDSVVLVGAEPAPSPFARRFDPFALPRVRAAAREGADYELDYWLRRLDDEDLRFVSDGDPDTVSVPSELVPRVRVRAGQRLRVLPAATEAP